MDIQTAFNKFDQKIKISRESEDYKDARNKDDSITSAIKDAFKEAGYPVKETFLQGSFKTNTAIKALDGDFDIDRGIVINYKDAPDNPVDCKKTLLTVLEKIGFVNATIKMPCVTADYASLNLHIDFPIYRDRMFMSNLKLAVGKKHSEEEQRGWSVSEPKELITWVNDAERHTGWGVINLTDDEKRQFKRLVRALKRWRNFQYQGATNKKYIYSIGLTIMLKESFKSSIDEDNDKADDLSALYATINYMLENKGYFIQMAGDDEKYDVNVLLPVAPNRDVFDQHGITVGTTLRRRLVKLRKKLADAMDEDSLKKQCEILQSMFGDDFPILENFESKKEDHSSYVVGPGIVASGQGA